MNRTSGIILGVSGGICLLIGIFLLWPGLARDWQTWRETQSAKKELQELAEKQKILGDLAKTADLDKIMTAAANYIPEEAKSSELILELSAIVGQANMAIEQISLESTTAQPAKEEETATTKTTQTDQKNTTSAQPVVFTLKIAGTFGNLMEFFKLIETSSRLIAIQGLKLSQEQDKFTAEIKGETYWKTVAAAEKGLANITVSAETIQKFENLRQYSMPINTATEAGYGRTNPFEEIK